MGRRLLESRPPRRRRGDTRIEHRCLARHVAALHAVGKLLARRRLDSIARSIEHAAAANEARADGAFELLQRVEQPVDRATGGILRVDIHRDREKTVVAPGQVPAAVKGTLDAAPPAT